jgi:putative MATE family efflux protein
MPSTSATPETESSAQPARTKTRPGLRNPGARMKLDLTSGSILPLIIKLAVPSALTNLLNFSYGFVDMLWLGRLGPYAIAVTATYHYFFMVLVFFNQIVGLGSMSLISRSFGARQYRDCRRIIGQTFAFKLVIAFVVMGLGLGFQRWAWVAFGSSPEVAKSGLQYTTIMFSVIPFYFSAFTLRTSFAAIGDMRTLLKISIVSAVFNLVFDPLMIFERIYIGPFPALGLPDPIYIMPGCGLGVAGAAWASFAAIVVLFVLGQYYFMSGKTYIRVPARLFFSWNWQTVKRITSIGVPPAIGENLNNIAQIVNGKILNIFGTAVFAAHGVVMQMFGLVFVPVGGVSQAVMTMVGQNLGAGKPERAQQCVLAAFTLTGSMLALILLCAFFWAEPVLKIFVPGHTAEALETIHWAAVFLRIALIVMFCMGVSMTFGAAFWGSGYTKPPMWITFGTTYAIQLPLILYGALVLQLADPSFVIWIMALTGVINAALTILIFSRGHWKTVKV